MSLSSPVSPASLIFASLTSPFVLKRILFSFPATNGWTIGQKTPLEGQSLIYHRIHPSFMSLSSPVTPSSFDLPFSTLSFRPEISLSCPGHHQSLEKSIGNSIEEKPCERRASNQRFCFLFELFQAKNKVWEMIQLLDLARSFLIILKSKSKAKA